MPYERTERKMSADPYVATMPLSRRERGASAHARFVESAIVC